MVVDRRLTKDLTPPSTFEVVVIPTGDLFVGGDAQVRRAVVPVEGSIVGVFGGDPVPPAIPEVPLRSLLWAILPPCRGR